MTLEHRIGRAIAVLGLAGILVATLTPNPTGVAAASTTPFWCLVCGGMGGVDVILNVILFIPLGIGLRLVGVPLRRAVVLSALLTMFIEGMQVSVVAGRDASLSDLLTNTAGGVIGALVAPHLRQLALPRRATAVVLTAVWAPVWLIVLASSAWLLQPWEPHGDLLVGWGLPLPIHRVFEGRVLAAAAGDIPLRPGLVPDSATLRRQLASGNIALSFDAIVGPSRPRWAPVLALLDHVDMVAGVFEARNNIVLELPTNAERLRLRNPALRLVAGRPAAAGELVRVIAGARGRTLWISSSYGGERRHTELALSPSFGWGLLIPFAYAYGPEVHILTALWIAGLLLPLGYWTRWARPTQPGRARALTFGFGFAALVAVGLAIIPSIAGFPPVHWSEWLAAIAGLAAGWAGASRVAYLAERCVSPSASESFSS